MWLQANVTVVQSLLNIYAKQCFLDTGFITANNLFTVSEIQHLLCKCLLVPTEPLEKQFYYIVRDVQVKLLR